MSRRSAYSSARWAIGLCLCVLAGCDPAGTATSSPSPLDVPKSVLDLPATQKTTKLVYIGTGIENPTQKMWEEGVVLSAGKAQVMVDVMKLKPGDPPTAQAQMVREAVAHGASALLVVAADPPSIASALEEARSKGVPVILLEHQVPVSGKPFTLITRPDPTDVSRQLVQAAAAEAKATDQKGPAIILSGGLDDERKSERAEALKKAIADAGLTLAEVVVFGEGSSNPSIEEGEKALAAAIAKHGSVGIVFCEDQGALTVATHAREKLKEKGDYVGVGFTTDPNSPKSVEMREFAAIVYLNAYGIARQAVLTAVKMVQGETVPETIEVKYQFYRSPGPRPAGGIQYMRDLAR